MKLLQVWFLYVLFWEKSMLKDYEIDKPVLETDRLLIRVLNEVDVLDLKEWLGRDEIYTYWGRKASKGEKNPELMFIDPRPWVKRRSSPDFDWGIVLKESNKVIGMIAVFDIQNARMVAISVTGKYHGKKRTIL